MEDHAHEGRAEYNPDLGTDVSGTFILSLTPATLSKLGSFRISTARTLSSTFAVLFHLSVQVGVKGWGDFQD